MNKFLWGVIIATLPMQSFASYSNNDFIENQAFPINSLIVSLFFLFGLCLVGAGIYGVKQNGENKNQYPLGHAVSKMVAGVLLLSSSGVYHMLSGTVTGSTGGLSSNNVLSLQDSNLLSQSSSLGNSWLGEYLPMETIEMLIGLIFLFGVYSFLKGIYLIKDAGAPKQQGQDSGVLKKSVIHLAAGMIAMNILDFACFLGNTFNVPMLCVA